MKTFGFDERRVRRIVAAVRKSEAGPVTRGPGGMPGKLADVRDIVILIKSYAEADDPARNRWIYTYNEMRPVLDAPDNYDDMWEEITDSTLGIVGGKAFNWAERMNVAYDGSTTSPTILGSGIDVGRTPANNFDVAPIPVDRVLPARAYLFNLEDETQVVRAWFDVPNMMDGSC